MPVLGEDAPGLTGFCFVQEHGQEPHGSQLMVRILLQVEEAKQRRLLFSISSVQVFFFLCLFERERDTHTHRVQGGEGQRERETQGPGSEPVSTESSVGPEIKDHETMT